MYGIIQMLGLGGGGMVACRFDLWVKIRTRLNPLEDSIFWKFVLKKFGGRHTFICPSSVANKHKAWLESSVKSKDMHHYKFDQCFDQQKQNYFLGYRIIETINKWQCNFNEGNRGIPMFRWPTLDSIFTFGPKRQTPTDLPAYSWIH